MRISYDGRTRDELLNVEEFGPSKLRSLSRPGRHVPNVAIDYPWNWAMTPSHLITLACAVPQILKFLSLAASGRQISDPGTLLQRQIRTLGRTGCLW